MSESSHDKVLRDLKDFITNTKIHLEKIMKMRIQCKESQMMMLRLFNPKCIKILEISNELSRKTVKHTNANTRKFKVKQTGVKKNQKVQFEGNGKASSK